MIFNVNLPPRTYPLSSFCHPDITPSVFLPPGHNPLRLFATDGRRYVWGGNTTGEDMFGWQKDGMGNVRGGEMGICPYTDFLLRHLEDDAMYTYFHHFYYGIDHVYGIDN